MCIVPSQVEVKKFFLEILLLKYFSQGSDNFWISVGVGT